MIKASLITIPASLGAVISISKGPLFTDIHPNPLNTSSSPVLTVTLCFIFSNFLYSSIQFSQGGVNKSPLSVFSNSFNLSSLVSWKVTSLAAI